MKKVSIFLVLCLVLMSTTTASANGYILPFHGSATYGERGVHDCGFSTGWKAVDLLPSENMVYASAAGTVSYVCRDSNQVALKVGDNLYTHLKDTGQKVGDQYYQGQAIGPMVTGSFNTACGYAEQAADHYHVHFCFVPDANGNFLADGYNLNINTGVWTKDGKTTQTGDQLVASGVSSVPVYGSQGMFNIFDFLLAGLDGISWWILSTFFLPPGTTQSTIFNLINWAGLFTNGVITVIELTGAALSTFNWWIPGACILLDLTLFAIQIGMTIYQLVMTLIKLIPLL